MADDAGAHPVLPGQAPAVQAAAEGEARAKYAALVRGLLMDAAEEGNAGAKGILKRLISNGADFNLRDVEGRNVLHRLCGHKVLALDLIDLVLTTGIDVNALDPGAESAVRILLQVRDNPVFLDPDARKEALRRLVNRGAHLGKNGDYGTSVLGNLCYYRGDYRPLIPIVRELVALGADVNVENGDGDRPLHHLASCGKPGVVEIIEFLLDNVADINARDAYGSTPLHMVQSVEVARVLIARGADVDAVDEDGDTPISTALWLKYAGQAVAVLMQYSADVHERLMVGAWRRAAYNPDKTPEAILDDQLMRVMREPVADLLEATPIPVEYRAFLRWATTSPVGVKLLEEARAKKAAEAPHGVEGGAGMADGGAGGESGDDDSDGDDSSAAAGSASAASSLRDLKLGPLEDDAWERRKHLVCCYVKTREARRGGAAKKPKSA